MANRKIKFIEVKSEIGAGTRGASLGVDAIKIAALDYGSDMFRRYETVEVKNENQMLFESPGSPYAKRIKGLITLYERIGLEADGEHEHVELVQAAVTRADALGLDSLDVLRDQLCIGLLDSVVEVRRDDQALARGAVRRP